MNKDKKTNKHDYIDTITSKLDNMKDEELKQLITKLIEERNYLIETLNIDPLTGVYNRRILSHIRNYTSVAICDIDNFKEFNDESGHQVGDLILQLVAKTLVSNCRCNDYVCRYGGDEFLIIFCGANEKIIKKRMINILHSLMDTFSPTKKQVTLSIGISSYKKKHTLDEIINEADKALYLSKQAGKNTITCYDELKAKNNISANTNIKKIIK